MSLWCRDKTSITSVKIPRGALAYRSQFDVIQKDHQRLFGYNQNGIALFNEKNVFIALISLPNVILPT